MRSRRRPRSRAGTASPRARRRRAAALAGCPGATTGFGGPASSSRTAVEVRLEPPLLVRCVRRRERVLPEVHGRGPGEDADADDEEERAEAMSHGSTTEYGERRSRPRVMTRTQRTLVVAAAVAAIVIAANASDGAYFSQSLGLGRARVPRPDDRASDPRSRGCARTAADRVRDRSWARSARGSRCRRSGRSARRRPCARSSGCSSTSPSRSRSRSCSGAATGRRARGGVSSASRSSPSYGLATRLFPDRFDAYDDPFNAYSAGGAARVLERASGCWPRSGAILAVGVVAHARRTSVAALARRPAFPFSSSTLYFTFSRGAWRALCLRARGDRSRSTRVGSLVWTLVVLGSGARLSALRTPRGRTR